MPKLLFKMVVMHITLLTFIL